MKTAIDWEQFEQTELERIARLERDDSAKRWAKYPRPNPFWNPYGYGSTLYKLRGDMGNAKLSPLTRKLSADAFYKILRNVQDDTLMSLRNRLIKASIAGDEREIARLTKAMRYHLREEQETGLDD